MQFKRIFVAILNINRYKIDLPDCNDIRKNVCDENVLRSHFLRIVALNWL
uniref:Uncharacterized protein n=2 Tax=Roseolovirus TaxID=40272 RepID=A0A2L2QA34_9BETA|nr:hypothetical protein [Human betaherpesvirus 6]AVI07409.1 hypothetical protein [Human betaherpesvirus 6A]ARM07068.1 hypothetical protein [Human betaherpesvirus 6]ARM08061.1 hypothetical protein [Human betaherpesvirus 6]ARM08666.1 hypothetical protein [Human betaherpesvirus 6]